MATSPSRRRRPESRSAPARQAVILVHGMGEQIPMDTIKGFAAMIWAEESGLASPRRPDPYTLWSKPDERTGSLELRRITTRESIRSPAFPNGVQTDFYELYWADLTAGSTWDQVAGWARYLLLRPTSRVPKDVMGAWIALWVATIVLGLIALAALLPAEVWGDFPVLARAALLAASGFGFHWLRRAATASFGRVVRYTRADPDNIAARKAVRERGLALLRAIHANPDYSRVVLAAHSLGTILAHDLIGYFWSEQYAARAVKEGTPAFGALAEVERTAAALDGTPKARAAHRAAQARLRRAIAATPQAKPGDRWLVSDLVTLGCPLTHAEFLLARDREDLARRKQARETCTAPPVREALDAEVKAAAETAGLPLSEPPALMAYPDPIGSGVWRLHHAAPFAAVRWTNVHDPHRFIYRGDLISGPVAENFGQAVEDVNLAAIDKPSSRFSHTLYWDTGQSAPRRKAVRDAVNLLDADG